MYWKLSLEREVSRQMVNDMMQQEGCTRSYALSVRSKFESEERHQEVEYMNDLIQKEAEEQESELPPTANTTVAEEVVITNEPAPIYIEYMLPPKSRIRGPIRLLLLFLIPYYSLSVIFISLN